MARKKKDENEAPEIPLDLNAEGGTDAENQQWGITARQNPAMPYLLEMIYDALVKRTEKIMLDYTQEAVNGRYFIDGVWHNIQPRDRAMGDAMLVTLKQATGLNPEDRRGRQKGKFQIVHQMTKAKFNGTVTTQGVKTGERAVIDLRSKKAKVYKNLDDVGMREEMQNQLKEQMRAESGLVLVSAPGGGGGFTTFWNACLESTDRYLRDFVGLDNPSEKETTAENVNLTDCDPEKGDSPIKLLNSMLLKQPDVFASGHLYDGETINRLCELVNEENKLVIIAVKAKDTLEALLRVLQLKPSVKDFAKAVTCVTNMRLIRKLNDTCKSSYQPTPQLLQKLGIPQGRVQQLYREWQQPPPPSEEELQQKKKKGEDELPPGACPLCKVVGPQCGGLFYRERTGIFEFLKVTDKIREALIKQPKLDVLRKVARAGGHRGLQEEGILMVAKGVTSLNELQRVMKG